MPAFLGILDSLCSIKLFPELIVVSVPAVDIPVDPGPAGSITERLHRVHSRWGKMLSLNLPFPTTISSIWCEALLFLCHSVPRP